MLLLVLAFAASATSHALGDDQTAFAAPHSHDMAVVHGAGGEPCCSDELRLADGTTCSVTGGCSLCMLVASSAAFAGPVAEAPELPQQAALRGHALDPSFRPPWLFQTV
jgi:hypothetical protein